MSSIDQVSQAIGALQAQTESLAKGQAAQRSEVSAMREDLKDMKLSMQRIELTVAEFAPAAKKVQKWEQRAVGVSLIGGLLGGTALTLLRGKLGL